MPACPGLLCLSVLKGLTLQKFVCFVLCLCGDRFCGFGLEGGLHGGGGGGVTRIKDHPERRLGMSGISDLSFYSPFLSSILFFC